MQALYHVPQFPIDEVADILRQCDETRPSCSRCRRNNAECLYSSDDGSARSSSSGSPGRQDSSLTLKRTRHWFDGLGASAAVYGIDNIAESTTGTPRIVLMHHFQHVFAELLPMLDGFDMTPILSLSIYRPFLLDTMLAVSASHLRFSTVSNSSHRVAEHFQQALALQSFQAAIEQPLDQQTADALMLTAMFLNLLSFSIVEDDDTSQSWVFNDHPDRLRWLSLSLGIKPLVFATDPFRQNSILGWIHEASDDEHRTFHGPEDLHSLRKVPSHWLDLAGLTMASPPEQMYYDPIRTLEEIDAIEPRHDNLFLYVNLIGSLDFDFRADLIAGDETAMWVMGMWLGFMCRYDFWWLRHRVRRDYRAICQWFDQRRVRERPGREGQMWGLLIDDLEAAPLWKGVGFNNRACEEL